MNRVAITIGDRTVYWDLGPTMTALILQNLIQVIGPADGDL